MAARFEGITEQQFNEKVGKKTRADVLYFVMNKLNILYGVIAIIWTTYELIMTARQFSSIIHYIAMFTTMYVMLTYFHDYLFKGGYWGGFTRGFSDGLNTGLDLTQKAINDVLNESKGGEK